jgi:hypothetical protein
VFFAVFHYGFLLPMLKKNKNHPNWKPIADLPPNQQRFYTSYWYAAFHAVITAGIAIYCMLYGNGEGESGSYYGENSNTVSLWTLDLMDIFI